MSATTPDLSTAIGALQLPHPILAASGTYGYATEVLPHADPSVFAAIVGKSISIEPRAGNAPPRTVETPAGMLNAIGLQNPGLERFLAEKLPDMRALGVPIVANIVGERKDEYVRLAEALGRAEGIFAIELNVSCPNVDGGRDFGLDPAALENLTRSVKAVCPLPVWVKLTPLVNGIEGPARACEAGGADALVVANTWPALAVDWRRRRPRLSRGMGGLSGPAIKPLTLRLVHLVRRACGLPIIAGGGIAGADDILDYMVAGAAAVQLGTILFTDPGIGERMLAELARRLEDAGVARLRDLIGTLEL